MNIIDSFFDEIEKIAILNLAPYESKYDMFDPAHNRRHLEKVRSFASELADKYSPEEKDLVDIAAVLHDIGQVEGRDGHEIAGWKILSKDNSLREELGEENFERILHAVREHRASTGNPQDIIAKIVSDADRTGTGEGIRRSFEFAKHQGMDDEESLLESAKHINNKFGKGGYGDKRIIFPETRKEVRRIYGPIIKAYKKNDIEGLKKILESEKR